MQTPNLRVAAIARAVAVSEPSDTRTVGDFADTDAKAVTVIPQDRSPIQQVTSTTPLTRALIASVNASGETDGGAE
jgi:hypothetical protein